MLLTEEVYLLPALYLQMNSSSAYEVDGDTEEIRRNANGQHSSEDFAPLVFSKHDKRVLRQKRVHVCNED